MFARPHWHAYYDQVYNDAEECYEALADFLGDKHFFFGDRYLYHHGHPCGDDLSSFSCLLTAHGRHVFSPSSLDAVAFGHLAIHLVAPQSHKLRSRLLQHKNLEVRSALHHRPWSSLAGLY